MDGRIGCCLLASRAIDRVDTLSSCSQTQVNEPLDWVLGVCEWLPLIGVASPRRERHLSEIGVPDRDPAPIDIAVAAAWIAERDGRGSVTATNAEP